MRALGNSVSTALLSLVLAAPSSFLLAWWCVRSNAFGRVWVRRVMVFPYFIPPFLLAVAWISLSAPRVGVLNLFFPSWNLNLYSWWGLVWVFAAAYFPILFSSFCRALEGFDPTMEEAARIAGAGSVRTLYHVTVPLLVPTILSSSSLFLMSVMSAFGIPALVGIPGRIPCLTTRIYERVRLGGVDGVLEGFVLSLWLLALVLVLSGLSGWVVRRKQYRLVSGKVARHSEFRLGLWRLPISGLMVGVTGLVVAMPLAATIVSSFLSVAGQMRGFTLRNYIYLFNMPELPRAVLNSAWLSLLTGFICCGVGFCVTYFRDRTQYFGCSMLFQAAGLGFSLPGSIISLAVILSFGSGWGFESLALYGSPVLLLIAYCSKYLALSSQSLLPAMANIDHCLDDAARICGASWTGVLGRILFPLLRSTIVGLFVFTAVPVFTELTMSSLLVGPGTETVGTVLFQLQEYANPLSACSLASLLILGLAICLVLSRRISASWGGAW